MESTFTPQSVTAAVLTALPRNGWTTPRAIADAVGKGYSTVTATLRDLQASGEARSEKQGRATVWQAVDPTAQTPQDETETPDAADATQTTPVPATVNLVPATATFTAAPGADPFDHTTYRLDEATPDEGVAPAVPEQRVTAVDVVAPAAEADDDPTPVSAPPAGAGMDDVLNYMEAVRPVSAAPAQTEDNRPVSGAPRTSTARRGESDRRNDWGRGELAAAALAYVVAKGAPAKPGEVAKAINGFTGSVDFALKQMAKKGLIERVPGDGPATYRMPSA